MSNYATPQTVKVATWNINSVRLRLPSIERFLKEQQPDVLGLQEIKCQNEQFPYDAFKALGYEHIHVAGQKAYHGAATISKLPMERLETDFCPLGHGRHVSSRVDVSGQTFEFHNVYVPAGGDVADPVVNDKFQHKLDFLKNMTEYFTARAAKGDDRLVLVGDLNIAPGEHDVWNHKQLLRVVSHTPLEVEKLARLQNTHGFIDCSRRHVDDSEKLYSWWSYRAKDVMASNRGRRLDHIWVTPSLAKAIDSTGPNGHEIHVPCRVWEKPSDHAPMTQEIDLSAL